MKITICVGSSCHLKGSRQIVEQTLALIAQHGLQDKVEVCGAFCMGRCTDGVCVDVNGEIFSLKPENTDEFFNRIILASLRSSAV